MEKNKLYVQESGQLYNIKQHHITSYSFIVVDLNCNIHLEKLLQFTDANYKNYEVVYCASQCNVQHDCLNFYQFNINDNVDEVLNTVICECRKDNIIVVRQIDDFEKLKQITEALTNDNQIAYFKKDTSKKNFAYKILSKIAKGLFSRKIIPMDLSVVGYSKMPSLVLKNLNTPSNALRLNDWVGVDRVELDGGNSCKMEYNKIKYAISLSANLFAFVLPIILLAVNIKMDFLLKMFLTLLCMVGGVMSFIIAINWFVKSQIGENNSNKAKILNKGEDKNEEN
ncbi:MAG: hypothetical protein E7378_00775 [Clostridiales bacterium]|nr:hypothetical protein [Clostridiales bacterium]